MQEKVIQIPFNSKFFLESHKAIWDFSNKKHLKLYAFYTILSLLTLISGWNFDRRDAFPVGIALGSSLLFYFFVKWVEFFERRVKYFSKVKTKAVRFAQESMESTYIFSDNGFECTDKEKSFKLVWSLFKPITIYKDNILLFLKDGGVIFSIGRSELGGTEYDELCDILREKFG